MKLFYTYQSLWVYWIPFEKIGKHIRFFITGVVWTQGLEFKNGFGKLPAGLEIDKEDLKFIIKNEKRLSPIIRKAVREIFEWNIGYI